MSKAVEDALLADAAAVIQTLAERAREHGMTSTARAAGVTREGLYKALAADGNPSFATVVNVAQALGFRVALVPAPVA